MANGKDQILLKYFLLRNSMSEKFGLVENSLKFFRENSPHFRNDITFFISIFLNSSFILEIIYLKYMYKQDLALNNLQCLVCHKTKPNQTNLDI